MTSLPDSRNASPGPVALPGSLRAFQVVVTTGGMQFLIAFLNLARSKTIALLLAPQGVGIVGVVDQLILLITQLSALSLSTAPIKFLSRTLNQGQEAMSRIYQALFKLLLVSTLTGTALGLLVLAFDPGLLGAKLLGYRNVILIALLTVPSLAFTSFFSNVLASARKYRGALFFMLICSFASVIAAYAGIRLGSIAGLYGGNLVVGVAAGLGVTIYLRRTLQLAHHSEGFRIGEELRRHPDILSFCVVIYILSFAQPLTFLIIRYTVLKNLGPTQAGYFHAAFVIPTLVSLLLTQSIRIYLEPIANRDLPQPEKNRTANDFQRTFAILVLLAALPMALFPREITILLFSSAFIEISRYLFLFVISECIFLAAQVYLPLMLGADDLRNYLSVQLFAQLCLAGLSVAVAPRYGLHGIAWVFVASRSALFLFTIWVLARRHGFRFAPGSAGLIVYSVGALALTGFLCRGGNALSVAGALSRAGAFLSLAAGACLFLGKEEKAWVRQTWERLQSGPS